MIPLALLLLIVGSARGEEVFSAKVDAAVAAEKVPEWREACEKNDGLACGDLGALYALGRGVGRDYGKALELYEKACRAGQALRCLRSGIFLGNGRGAAASLDKAAEYFSLGCKLFDPDSCAAYYALTQGRLIALDGTTKTISAHPAADPAMLQSVATTLTLACDRGMANPCGNLAGLYEEGGAVARSLPQALHFYERACELGDGDRCARAGRYYANGQGAPGDKTKAATLFQRACELNHAINCPLAAKARKGLAIELKLDGKTPEPVVLSAQPAIRSNPEMKNPPPFSPSGIPAWALEAPLDPVPETGLPPDSVALVRACNHGDARACGNAAAPFVDENGVPKGNAELARRLYQKACSFGRAQRCADLARFYENGWGAEKSPGRVKAAKKRACTLGLKDQCGP
ncbi:MAG: tetratricopeptide repeat protein [Bdellovibrionota bacterium]